MLQGQFSGLPVQYANPTHTMPNTILDPIPFTPDFQKLAASLKIKPGSSIGVQLQCLAEQATTIARPKVLYKVSTVEPAQDGSVLLDGIHFHSRILCLNLEGVHRAFPYIATCGLELHQWKESFDDPFAGYLVDAITALALQAAIESLFSHLERHFGLGKTATMNPGSLEDWPLQAQIPLFSLLGDPPAAIGVNLTDSLLMIPRQSVSGLLFETEKDFINCKLCPREGCTNRRATYDQALRDQYLNT